MRKAGQRILLPLYIQEVWKRSWYWLSRNFAGRALGVFCLFVLYKDLLFSEQLYVYNEIEESTEISHIPPSSMYACCCLVAKSCPALCNPIDCTLQGSSLHEIFQARILEWVTISFSRGSARPRDGTHASCTRRQITYHWATREAHSLAWYPAMNAIVSFTGTWCS